MSRTSSGGSQASTSDVIPRLSAQRRPRRGLESEENEGPPDRPHAPSPCQPDRPLPTPRQDQGGDGGPHASDGGPNELSDNQNLTGLQRLEEYSQRTTFHGISYFCQKSATGAPLIIRQLLWAILILVCSGFFLYYFINQSILIFAYKTNNAVKVIYKDRVPFPTVTVCNQNRFRLSPSVERGWYSTAQVLSSNNNTDAKRRICEKDEFTCTTDGSCLALSSTCDSFPDCPQAEDELNCTVCTLLSLETDEPSLQQHAGLYLVQPDTYDLERPVYVSVAEPYRYLYHWAGAWVLAASMDGWPLYASVNSSATTPQALGGNSSDNGTVTTRWSLQSGREIDINVTCQITFKSLLIPKNTSIHGEVDMLELYNVTAHRQSDFIESCTWKGEDCSQSGTIREVYTDLGVCYEVSFTDSFVEQAGAGTGLIMEFNIEQYEYVKDTSEGLGIKLFMHEGKEVPPMVDRGQAVSPGLVSFIAIESTTITNLKPPYGDCGEKELKYYDSYSTTRCSAECETEYLDTECGCRDFYLPHSENFPPSCDVQTYLSCAVESIDEVRAAGNYCACPDACERDEYVSTTSFAVRLAELGNSQDEKTFLLQKSLANARETTYRHSDQKYRATVKASHAFEQQTSRLVKFLAQAQHDLERDDEQVTSDVLRVTADCHWVRDMFLRAMAVIRKDVLKPLAEIKLSLQEYTIYDFPEVETHATALIKEITDAKAEFQLDAQELVLDFGTCMADCRWTGLGTEYSGNRSTTISGHMCQPWMEQSPHSHPYTDAFDSRFPDDSLIHANNFCRNPDQKATGPWCYTIQPGVEWETCQVPICSSCRDTELGTEFQGNRQYTLSGRLCQRWDSQSPHSHGHTDPTAFPDRSLAEAVNFCRNPDGRATGPWCYTTDPARPQETCAIPLCHECRMTSQGVTYSGTHAVTRSGRPCQRWDMQYPHTHQHTDPARFPDLSLEEAANFCRNPDHKRTGPWCFTTDAETRWETCGLPLCAGCKTTAKGTDYKCDQSFTIFGRACQRWDSSKPHTHSFTDPALFPDSSLAEASNYCRNPDPDNHSTPWCYTTDPDREWEPCDIALCADCKDSPLGQQYQGNHPTTVGGRVCQRWDLQYPHQHVYIDSTDFPDSSLADANNYCRNPDNNLSGPWCYTIDPDVLKEICDIPQCTDCRDDDLGLQYTGTRSQTVSGYTCQPWTSRAVHAHPTYTDTQFPDGSVEEAAHFCRNPDRREGTGPWCYTTDPSVEWETCDVPICPAHSSVCIHTAEGRQFTGIVAVTSSGRACQRWDSMYPHQHPFINISNFPDASFFDAWNYCRNPDGRPGTGPWCYTTDPDVQWESCNIALCSECADSSDGTGYLGTRSVTQSGRLCQSWTSMTPHSHSYTSDSDFPDASVTDASNYCRNPDGKLGVGPWCYTTDPAVEWEACGMKTCTHPPCRITDLGREYTGSKSTTMSGRPCQRWDMQVPHKHNMSDPSIFPEDTLQEANNYCRNPDGREGTGPWCYTMDPFTEWEPCHIIRCQECTMTARGSEYIGTQTATTSGQTCQPWSTQFPHRHNFTDPAMFPDHSVEAANNYCRNPDGRTGGPWCFTMDPHSQWQFCDIPSCADCKTTHLGEEYAGHQSSTISGRRCQRWDQQTPNPHPYLDANFPESTLADVVNYCRNPDGKDSGPWCYTLDADVEWETCGIQMCYERGVRLTEQGIEYKGTQAVTQSGRPCQHWITQSPHPHSYISTNNFSENSMLQTYNYCRNPDGSPEGPWCYTTDPVVERDTCGIPMASDCRKTFLGELYKGMYSSTMSGRRCQRWDKQAPHAHSYTDSDFPDYTISDAANFCRNPSAAQSQPWCYTTDPDVELEPCAVPLCTDCKSTHVGTEYQDSRTYTVSGRICQRWDVQTPHTHAFTSSDFPDTSLADTSNYCRNPDGDTEGPWCFTIDPTVTREYCGIDICTGVGCVMTALGSEYRGRHSLTMSGRLCQRWDSQTPNSHTYTDGTNFPDDNLEDAANHCRNPDDDPEGPWCYTMDQSMTRESCGIPSCSECYERSNYRGKRSLTVSGRICQRWQEQNPHSHSYGSNDFPGESRADAQNYCRNPDNRASGPWCFTTDPDVSSETCAIQVCSTNCRTTYHGYDYQGDRAETVSGRRCQRWDAQVPHAHSDTTAANFPDSSLVAANNYCRNPDRKNGTGPWCYTEDVRVEWEPCGVQMCRECTLDEIGTDYTGSLSTTLGGYSCQGWGDVSPHNHIYTESWFFSDGMLGNSSNNCRNHLVNTTLGTGPWCYTTNPSVGRTSCGIPICHDCITGEGMDYTGRRSTTQSGIQCQRWDTNSPHRNSYGSTSDYPEDSLADAANYCRNPSGDIDGPWCYTTDPAVETESCGLPQCHHKDCTLSSQGMEYRGRLALTVSGRTCQRWGEYGGGSPHTHSYSDSDFPDGSATLAYNHCRNPAGAKAAPWCLTTDPLVEWEYCPVTTCHDCMATGQIYTGRQAVTMTGRPCQPWAQVSPHRHQYTDADFPDGSLEGAANYCRQPDGSNTPWCLTMDPQHRREDCDIYTDCDKDCYSTAYGAEYTGGRSHTLSGRMCQRWDAQTPHPHGYTDPVYYPDSTLSGAGNGCRNPDQSGSGRERPWCYTEDPDVEWEYCSIRMCANARDDCTPSANGTDYVGTRTTTGYGRTCQRWDETPPFGLHAENITGSIVNGELVDILGNTIRINGTIENATCDSSDGTVFELVNGTLLNGTYLSSSMVVQDTVDYWNCTLLVTVDDRVYPEGNATDASNYCRNPDGREGSGAWCYTTDPAVELEACDVPICIDQQIVTTAENVMDITTSADDGWSTTAEILADTTATSEPDTTMSTAVDPPITVATPAPSTPSYPARRCDFHLQRSINRRNVTIWEAANRMVATLRVLTRRTVNTSDLSHYHLNKTMIDPIRSNVGKDCPWCDSSASILTQLRQRVDQWKEDVIDGATLGALTNVRTTMHQYLSKDWVLNPDKHAIQESDVAELRTSFRSSAASIKSAVEATQQTMREAREVLLLTNQLLQYVWSLECQKQLPKLLNEFERYKTTFKKVINEFQTYLKNRNEAASNNKNMYMNGTSTLQNMASSINFDDIRLKTISHKIKMQNAINSGTLLIQNIRVKINQIYYSIMACVNVSYIQSKSFYWDKMDIQNPMAQIPTQIPIQGILLPGLDFGMLPGPEADAYWDGKEKHLSRMRDVLDVQITQMDGIALATRTYFETYTKGNKIDEDFYKKNFLQVDVFYKDMTERSVEQEKIYEYPNLLSDVGGFMGLLLGASLLTVGELVDLIIQACCGRCRK